MFAVHPLAPAVLIFLDLKKQPLVCIKEIQCISKFLIPPHTPTYRQVPGKTRRYQMRKKREQKTM